MCYRGRNLSAVINIRPEKFMQQQNSRQLKTSNKHTFIPFTSTLCLKKVPTFKFSLTLSNLNRFSKFLHCWKAYEITCMKFATKPIRQYPPHLRHVATLPWEITNANFMEIFSTYGRKCKQIAFLSPLPLLFIHKCQYF